MEIQCSALQINQVDLRVAFYESLPLMEMIGLLLVLARGWVFLVSLLCDDLGHCISDGAVVSTCLTYVYVYIYVATYGPSFTRHQCNLSD